MKKMIYLLAAGLLAVLPFANFASAHTIDSDDIFHHGMMDMMGLGWGFGLWSSTTAILAPIFLIALIVLIILLIIKLIKEDKNNTHRKD